MKEKILELRENGLTYNEIKDILGCSKSTISYHCGEGQKEKSRLRLKKNRKTLYGTIRNKIDKFVNVKVRNFRKESNNNLNIVTSKATYDAFYKKIIESDVCYLTGRLIDLSNTKTYSLDHIHPISKGGRNTLVNMGVSCREANQAKFNLELDDFILLCKDVCENFGYKVIK